MLGLSIARWLVVGNSGQSFRRVFNTIQGSFKSQRYLAVLTERLRWDTDGDLSGPGLALIFPLVLLLGEIGYLG